MFDYDGYIVGLDYDLDQAYDSAVLAHWAIQDARTAFDGADKDLALDKVIQAGYHTDKVFDRLLFGWSKTGGWWREKTLAGAIRDDLLALEAGDPYELTLTKMLAAYIIADDSQRSAHRFLLDAYQASLYDKPFDLEYHKTWVRMFSRWQ